MKGTFGIILAVACVVALVVLYDVFGSSPSPRQLRNMGKAKEHLPILLPIVKAERRYRHIEMIPFSDGTLRVSGTLASKLDLSDLEKAIADTNPPASISYRVSVRTAEFLSQLDDDSR